MLRPYPRCTDDLPQVDVHPVVAAHQVPVVGLPVLQLHQLRERTGQGGPAQRRYRDLPGVTARHRGGQRGWAARPVLTMGWFCAVFSKDRGNYGGKEKRKASGTGRQRDTGLGTPSRALSAAQEKPSMLGRVRDDPGPPLRSIHLPSPVPGSPFPVPRSPSCRTREPPPRRALPLKPPPAPRGANQNAASSRRSQSERDAVPPQPIRARMAARPHRAARSAPLRRHRPGRDAPGMDETLSGPPGTAASLLTPSQTTRKPPGISR